MSQYSDPRGQDPATHINVGTAVVTPTDRIRWGPILAGVFAALTTLAVLTTLGAAIGLSAYDRGDDSRAFAIGASVWGIISMIIAFFIGGWITARSAAVRGRDYGLLNGAMVACVGIPLFLLLLGSAGTMMGHAEMANNRDAQVMSQYNPAQAGQAANERTDQTVESARRTAWGTLVAFVLAIGSSAIAGYLGARTRDDHHHSHTTAV